MQRWTWRGGVGGNQYHYTHRHTRTYWAWRGSQKMGPGTRCLGRRDRGGAFLGTTVQEDLLSSSWPCEGKKTTEHQQLYTFSNFL